MNLANKITLFRIILVFPFSYFMITGTTSSWVAALAILVIASITDYIDGKVARSRNEVSVLGKLMDPLADKLFSAAAFIFFIDIKELSIPAWPIVLIIAREFIISSLRAFLASRGKIMIASIAGKIKTIVQLIAIHIILLSAITGFLTSIAKYIIFIVLIVTVYSGMLYFYNNRMELYIE